MLSVTKHASTVGYSTSIYRKDPGVYALYPATDPPGTTHAHATCPYGTACVGRGLQAAAGKLQVILLY